MRRIVQGAIALSLPLIAVLDYYTRAQIPRDKRALAMWWDIFLEEQRQRGKENAYDLYAIIFALATDTEAVTLLTDPATRAEIADVSGRRSCVLYFRQEAQNAPGHVEGEGDENFDYLKEHARFVNSLREIFRIALAELPCMLFFSTLDSDPVEYAVVSLKHLSHLGIATMLRELFDRVSQASNTDPLDVVAEFSETQRRRIARRELWDRIQQIAGPAFALLRWAVPKPLPGM